MLKPDDSSISSFSKTGAASTKRPSSSPLSGSFVENLKRRKPHLIDINSGDLEEVNDDDILLVDSDDDDKSCSLNSKLMTFEVSGNVHSNILETLEELNFESNLANLRQSVDEKLKDVEGNLHESRRVLADVDNAVDKIWNTLYNESQSCRKRLPDLDIEEDAEILNDSQSSPSSSTTQPSVKLEDEVLVERSSDKPWELARIFKIFKKGLTIKFESGEASDVDDGHVAFSHEPEVPLKVGTDIVARRKDGKFYSGVIAEPLKKMNCQRYLIFFNDHRCSYVRHSETRRLLRERNFIDRNDFFKLYFLRYPERPLVRLSKGDQVKVEYKGKWEVTEVREVDVSLVRVRYQEQVKEEWLYRGSPRLGPIYAGRYNHMSSVFKHTEKSTNIEATNLANIVATTKSGIFQENIELQKETKNKSINVNEDTFSNDEDESTADVNSHLESTLDSSSKDSPEEPSDSKDSNADELNVTPGKITQIKGNFTGPNLFYPHSCSPACVFSPKFTYLSHWIKDYNVLVIPLLCGWERRLERHSNKGRRKISYRAPCGRICRDISEVSRYLQLTNQGLEVDFFNFDWWLHVLNVFTPTGEKFPIISDISYGKEAIPISSVNSVDSIYPEFIEYTRERLPQGKVSLNTDPEFLVGCSCSDNCADKASCSCWQLTIQSSDVMETDEDTGYLFKRLENVVLSGIYECNSRCSCSNTCLNRVVQQPLRTKLQVFKTSARGWGVRTLHDLPSGTFVCVYVGNLYHPVEGNKQGKDFGDEYLADLDFIELVENSKEGYESDAKDLEGSNLPKSKKGKRSKKKTKSDSLSKSSFNRISTRKLYGGTEEPFIMCAKKIGNVGRYLNHSCNPNVFVQNVMVDTHDVRFPWLAFFTSTYVPAGRELCWDYNYTVGSIPGKELYCCCEADTCRGRLL